MAQLPGGFDPATVKDNDLLPLAQYKLAITKTSSKPNSKDPSKNVYGLEMDVQDGQFQGRKVFINLNLESDNETARNIAQRELKNIVMACGLPALKGDLDELIGIPFLGDVVVQVSKDPQYQDKNVIKKYYPATVAGIGVTNSASPAKGPWSN